MGRVKHFSCADGPDCRNIRCSFRPSRRYDLHQSGGWRCRPIRPSKHFFWKRPTNAIIAGSGGCFGTNPSRIATPSSSDDSTDSLAPMCSANMFVSVSCSRKVSHLMVRFKSQTFEAGVRSVTEPLSESVMTVTQHFVTTPSSSDKKIPRR